MMGIGWYRMPYMPVHENFKESILFSVTVFDIIIKYSNNEICIENDHRHHIRQVIKKRKRLAFAIQFGLGWVPAVKPNPNPT